VPDEVWQDACSTVGDPKEVWQFEIFGAGVVEKGAPFIFNPASGMGSGPITPNRREWRVLSILAPSLKLDPWAPETEARRSGRSMGITCAAVRRAAWRRSSEVARPRSSIHEQQRRCHGEYHDDGHDGPRLPAEGDTGNDVRKCHGSHSSFEPCTTRVSLRAGYGLIHAYDVRHRKALSMNIVYITRVRAGHKSL
jgi:hypothetical protein